MSDLNLWNTVAAWVGAIGVVFQGIIFLYKYFKPSAVTITGNLPIVQFTDKGPMLNLDLALHVKQQYALINTIKIQLLHIESGAKHNFRCIGFLSRYNKKDFFPIELEPLYKGHFFFQEINFIGKTDEIFKKIMDEANFLAQNGQDCLKALEGRSFQEFINSCKENFLWKTGKYQLSFIPLSPERINVIKKIYEFELLPNTLHHLENNIGEIKSEFEFELRSRLNNDNNGLRGNFKYLEPALTELI